ncbi:MAG: hypothetical protein J6C50_00250 [Rickettsiales bacterium]|nr:hypothetical protein [Rickettsiales bacterium]
MFNKIKNKINQLISFFEENSFNIVLISILCIVFIVSKKTTTFNDEYFNFKDPNRNQIKIFIQDNCYHCKELEKFLTDIGDEKYKHNITFYNLTENVRNYNLLVKYINKHNIPLETIGTPIIFYNDTYMIGFNSGENDKQLVESILENSLISEKEDNNVNNAEKYSITESFLKISFLSTVSIYNIIIAFLLLLVAVLFNNGKRAKLLILCFFLSSCIVNFLFLIDWINPFLIARWTRSLNLILGLFVLFYSIKYFYLSAYKQNKNIFESNKEKLSNFLILSTICLTFIVNITKFVKNEFLFTNYITSVNNINTILKYLLLILTSIMSSLFITLFIILCYKFLEKYLFKNNNYIYVIKYQNIFNAFLFSVGVYLAFIIVY